MDGTYTVIRLQIIDLLPENQVPYILAKELDYI